MKKVRRIITVVLAVVMVMSCAVPALAAEADGVTTGWADVNEVATATEPAGVGVSPRYVKEWSIGRTYVMVIGSEVRNATVHVDVHDQVDSNVAYNPNDYQVDIIVNGANGRIWSEEDWMKDRNYNSFWIGTDVTGVLIRIVPRNRLLFPAPAKAFRVQVTY